MRRIPSPDCQASNDALPVLKLLFPSRSANGGDGLSGPADLPGREPNTPSPSANGGDGRQTWGDVPGLAPATPSPSANGGDGRDSRGRFAKGNKHGRGNPFNRRVAALRSLLLELVSEEDLRGIAAKLVAKARAGDLAAAKVVLLYLIGRPADAVDPDRVALDEWRIYLESPTIAQLMDGQANRLDLETACLVARLMQDDNLNKIRDGVIRERAVHAAGKTDCPTPPD